MPVLRDDRGMLPLSPRRLNVYVVDNELFNLRALRARGLAAHRSLGCIVHHVVWHQVARVHLLARGLSCKTHLAISVINAKRKQQCIDRVARLVKLRFIDAHISEVVDFGTFWTY